MSASSTSQPSRITCSIDLRAPGINVGYLGVMHSNNRHAYGLLPVPITCIKHGEGPTVLITAGNHGDEHEGPIITRHIIANINLERVRGRIIIMPALNYPAVLADARVSPIDDGNMNRAYPGDPAGTPTFAIAHYVETELLPQCQFALDLHSGGKASEFLPCAFLVRAGNSANDGEFLSRKIDAAEAFAAPTTCVVAGTADQRSLSAAADRHGVVNIATELAGGGTVSRAAVDIGLAGTWRWLVHAGVLDDHATPAAQRTQFLRVRDRNDFVIADKDCVFQPNVVLGDIVHVGDTAGWQHPIADAAEPAAPAHFSAEGVVLCRRVPARALRGDFLFHLGTPTDAGALLTE